MSDIPDLARLADYFDQSEVKWKPQTVKDNRALAVAYIDARCVMDRFDAVVGVAGWCDRYEIISDGGIVCTIGVKVGGEWIFKSDVGGESQQPDEDDRRKAAFSDALKRAAVHWGVGRYLYSLPRQWYDFDPRAKAFARQPALPAWALPEKTAATPDAAAEQDKADLSKRKRIEMEARLNLASNKQTIKNIGDLINEKLKEQLLPADLEGLRAFYKAAIKKFKGQGGQLVSGTGANGSTDGDAKE
jgi:hypothetical protein